MKEHLTTLIDNKNTDLWTELSDTYEIEIIESQEEAYATKVIDNTATISINKNDLNAASFTHELLHIYLKSKDVKIEADLNSLLEKSEKANKLFSNGLKEHLINCLEHELMRPVFLEMGYENRFFKDDFNEPKMNKKMLGILLERYLKNNIYDREALEFYIGTFFSMKSCNNKAFKYHKYYIAFKNLDKGLYTLLSEFWLDWKTFNFEDIDDDYDKILQYFIEDLNRWIYNKTIS